MIANQLKGHNIQMTDYQRMCVMSASQNMYELIQQNNINPNKIANDISNILMTVTSLQLNANAQPSEVYFQTRNVYDKNTKQKHMTIEMGIEGDGNDAILARFGRNVKHVYTVWIVRKGDKYVPSKRKGIHVTDPEWEPGDDSESEVTDVVYPIEFWTDDNKSNSTVEYYSTTRELVKPNLLAHMLNNIMGERWGKDKKPGEYEEHRNKIKQFFKEHTLDEILDDPSMAKNISPAWKEPQSREQMIIRKMRNNIVKKIPKDFSNGLAVQSYEETANESLKKMRKDVTDNANQEVIEPEFESIDKSNQSTTNDSKQDSENSSQEEPTTENTEKLQEKDEPTPDSPNTEAAEKEGEPF